MDEYDFNANHYVLNCPDNAKRVNRQNKTLRTEAWHSHGTPPPLCILAVKRQLLHARSAVILSRYHIRHSPSHRRGQPPARDAHPRHATMPPHMAADDHLEHIPPSDQRPSRSSTAEVRSDRAADGRFFGAGVAAREAQTCPAVHQTHFSAASSATNPAPPARLFFDPWYSSSTGHQRAENRLSGSTSWRASRNLKLGEQFKGGLAGGGRVADAVGAGSADFGKVGRKANGGWERGARGLRTGGQRSLVDVWGAAKGTLTAHRSSQEEQASSKGEASQVRHEDVTSDTNVEPTKPAETQIFKGLCFYLNGSTAPLVSDHKLKHMLAVHGANHSIALGRRTVTHVILGTTCGGGLAASKIQKEIAKKGGESLRFVTVDW